MTRRREYGRAYAGHGDFLVGAQDRHAVLDFGRPGLDGVVDGQPQAVRCPVIDQCSRHLVWQPVAPDGDELFQEQWGSHRM